MREILLSMLVLCVASSCTRKSVEPQAETAAPRVVNLAIWSNYLSPESIAEFEKKSGIKVNISNYSSNEELLAKLQAGASGYDVIVPSDYMIFAMIQLNLLKEIDRAQVPNAKALDRNLLGKYFDQENKFSLPYDWGTTGIAINRDAYKGEIKGWKQVFENKELAGKFSLLDDVRETLGAALKAQGLSLNTQKPEELTKAKALLMKIRGNVKAFTSEPIDSLTSGEVAVAHAYVSDALQARKASGGKIEYVIPEEGATLWIDNLAIPAKAEHVKEAHEFINFVLDAKTGVSTALNVFVAPSNLEAFKLLPADVQSNPSLFPAEGVKKRLEMMEDLGEGIAAWERIWTEIKAENQ